MNQEKIKKINEYFEKLGLNQKEIKVYLFLMANGPQLVSTIAKGCHITRTHAYDIVKNLEQSGLCNSLGSEYGKKIQACSGEQIRDLIREKEKDLEVMKSGLDDVVIDLNSMIDLEKQLKPRVSYFYGSENLKKMINLSLHANEKIIRAAGSEMNLIKIFGEGFIVDYHVRRVEKRKKFLALRPGPKRGGHEILVNDADNLREIRLRSSRDIRLNSNIMMWDNYTAVYSLGIESFGTLIENEELTVMMKSWFDFIWFKSKKI